MPTINHVVDVNAGSLNIYKIIIVDSECLNFVLDFFQERMDPVTDFLTI